TLLRPRLCPRLARVPLLSRWLGRSPRCSLSPYTPLFRSPTCRIDANAPCVGYRSSRRGATSSLPDSLARAASTAARAASSSSIRSEEHTSELQSRENLVCRLLLEKKKRWLGLYMACLLVA